MDTRSRPTLRERGHEQRCARGRLQVGRPPEVGLRRVVEDEHVRRRQALLLHPRWRNENVVMVVGAGAD